MTHFEDKKVESGRSVEQLKETIWKKFKEKGNNESEEGSSGSEEMDES